MHITLTTQHSQSLERRNKRLEFWAKHLTSKDTKKQPNEYKIRVTEMLTTYRLLISRLGKAQNDKDYLDTEMRVMDLERYFVSMFEESRCATSNLAC